MTDTAEYPQEKAMVSALRVYHDYFGRQKLYSL